MNVLITGGAGFIGSHLTEYFLGQGDRVTILDDLSTGRIQNIEPFFNHPHFQFVSGSVLEPHPLDGLVEKTDFVYHLAASVGVKLIVTDPVRTIETNIRGTEQVMHYCNQWRKPVLLASTSEVYGKNKNEKFNETDDMVLGATTHSRWSYACSKAIDEFLALSYHRKNKLPALVVRLFNTVGPRQVSQYGMVLPTFVRQALSQSPITVYGTGEQTRTFCHVLDVVHALAELPKHPSLFGQVFNVGGNEEVSILNLAKLVKELCNSKSDIVFIPYDKAYEPGFEDMPKRVPDITKIGLAISYKPKFSLRQIVQSVISHEQNSSQT